MSIIELAAMLAGFVMAIARLARVAAPLWNYGPAWVQPLLATLPLVLTQLGGALGAVQTKMDLTEALLVGCLTLAASIRGAVSKAPAAALLLFVGLGSSGCAAFAPQEATIARDAYQTAKTACEIYDLAPAERRNPEMDRVCRSMRLVCE
jgi:hypothetical protein